MSKFKPIKLITFIYQAGFQGQRKPSTVKGTVRVIKECADLFKRIQKL